MTTFASVVSTSESFPTKTTIVIFSLEPDVTAAQLDLSVSPEGPAGCRLHLSLAGQGGEALSVALPSTAYSAGLEPIASFKKKKRELTVQVPWADTQAAPAAGTAAQSAAEASSVAADRDGGAEAAASKPAPAASAPKVAQQQQRQPASAAVVGARGGAEQARPAAETSARGANPPAVAEAAAKLEAAHLEAGASAPQPPPLPASFATDACNHCGARSAALQLCAPCKSVAYCCREHQKLDWKAHKPACLHLRAKPDALATAASSEQAPQRGRPAAASAATPSAAGDSSAGYSGTLRWGPDTTFPPLPAPPKEWAAAAKQASGSGPAAQAATALLQGLLRQQLAGGWSSFVPWRVPPDAATGNVVVEPTQLDGLSFPATLMWVMGELGLLGGGGGGGKRGAGLSLCGGGGARPAREAFTVLIAGASERCEQRLLEDSPYWAEAAAAAHPLPLRLCFVGPEVSAGAHLRESGAPAAAPTLGEWSSLCFRGTCGEFLRQPKGTPAGDAAASVQLVIGYNTGFASGRILLESWAPDLCDFLDRGVPCVFTCANDFIDGKNEPLVMRAALRAKVVLAPRACPFRAVSTFHAPGKRDESWCCANSFVYAVQGYATDDGRPSEKALEAGLAKVAVSLKLETQTAW